MFAPGRYIADTRESANQSLPFCMAAMVVDGRLTTQSFTADRFKDPRIVALMAKIKADGSREFDRVFPEKQCARVTLKTRCGEEWVSSVDHPKGDPRTPMTMEDVTTKFTSLAQGCAGSDRIDLIREKVMSCERMKASAFMETLAVRAARK
jgi:2-methylcitrate dehydratase